MAVFHFPFLFQPFDLVVGLLFGMYGLCSSILTGIYRGAFNSTDLAGFQLFMSLLTLITSFIAAFVLMPFETKSLAGFEDEDEEFLLAANSMFGIHKEKNPFIFVSVDVVKQKS